MSDLSARFREVAEILGRRFLGKEETIRLLLVALLSGEHALLVGPPGTAKSALIRGLAELLDARCFEYLLTRFTEPNELFGPVDIAAFREGTYRRRTEGMLPEAEIVFLDEVFKSNSAILNSLLGILNERRYTAGGTVHRVPLLSAFGATNELPGDETLAALFDRFLLRIRSVPLPPHQFDELLQVGLAREVEALDGTPLRPVVTMRELATLSGELARRLHFRREFLARYRALVFQLRAEGVTLSDRRAVKLLKLFAASAWLDGREAVDDGDLYLLKHVWNTEDQAEVLEQIVGPVVEEYHRAHPERRRVGNLGAGLAALAAEVERVRQVLTEGAAPSDRVLFSELRALGEVRAALAAIPDARARTLEQRVVQLLDATLSSGRFAGL